MRTSESICSLAHSSPERGRGRKREIGEGGGGGGGGRGGGWAIYLQSLLSPLQMFVSPPFSVSLPPPFFLWQIEAQKQNVAWLNISVWDFLPVVFSLIGSSKATMSQAWPRRSDPIRICHCFLFLSRISNIGQSWPTFSVHRCDKIMKSEAGGRGWVIVVKTGTH